MSGFRFGRSTGLGGRQTFKFHSAPMSARLRHGSSPTGREVRSLSQPAPYVAYKARLLSCGWVPMNNFSGSVMMNRRHEAVLVKCRKKGAPDTEVLMAIKYDPALEQKWEVRKAGDIETRRYRLGMLKYKFRRGKKDEDEQP